MDPPNILVILTDQERCYMASTPCSLVTNRAEVRP